MKQRGHPGRHQTIAVKRGCFSAAFAGAILLAASAQAACPARVGVAFGDTLSSIASACGVSVESLRRANSGLTAGNLQAGTFIRVPRPVLPSPMIEIGQPQVRIAPALVPPSAGGGSPTVFLPPQPLPVPPQHILRGFGDAGFVHIA